MFPANHCVFFTYIVPLAVGRARCPIYGEEILLGFTVPVQPNLRAAKCQHTLPNKTIA